MGEEKAVERENESKGGVGEIEAAPEVAGGTQTV